MNKSYEWYLVPKDADTNEAIATYLNQANEATGNEVIFEDNLGVEHRGWRVQFSTIGELQRNAGKFSLKFIVYVKEGNGLPHQSLLHLKRPKSSKLKKVEEALAKII